MNTRITEPLTIHSQIMNNDNELNDLINSITDNPMQQSSTGGSKEPSASSNTDSNNDDTPSTSSSSWNVIQTFGKNRDLTNTQLGIIYNAIKDGNLGFCIYEQLDEPPENEEENIKASIDALISYGYNIHNWELGNIALSCLRKAYPNLVRDFMIEVFDILNEGNNLIVQNQHKAKIYQTIEEERTSVSDSLIQQPHVTEIQYALSKITNSIAYVTKAKSYEDLMRQNAMREFALMTAYRVMHGRFTKYITAPLSVKYVAPIIKMKHDIVSISKDIQRKFNQPGKYFAEIKKYLKLQPNGFYCYDLNGIMVPILCKHEWMSYQGKPPNIISIECYKKGKCKYCGQEMMAYHEQVRENLPPKIYDLIYKYMATINENIEETSLLYALFTLIYDSIAENVNRKSVKNYDAVIVAYAGLYLYVIYLSTKSGIHYNNKVNKFLDSVKQYWSEVGWTNETITKAAQNTKMFPNMDKMTDIIKEKIYDNKITFLDVLPLSILFHTNADPMKLDELVAKTKMQKLWKEGPEKMNQFNTLFSKSLMSLWKFTNLQNNIEKLGKKSIKINYEVPVIKTETVKNGEKFFYGMCEEYCPVSYIHEWNGNGNVCKHCGLKKDLSNKKDIYTKYFVTINNSYLQRPSVLPIERFKIEKLYKKEMIEKYKGAELFDKYIKIDNHIMKQKLNESIDSGKYTNELLKLVSTLTTIELDKLPKTPEFIKQGFSFVVDNHIKSADDVLNELKNICFSIKNINWIFIS